MQHNAKATQKRCKAEEAFRKSNAKAIQCNAFPCTSTGGTIQQQCKIKAKAMQCKCCVKNIAKPRHEPCRSNAETMVCSAMACFTICSEMLCSAMLCRPVCSAVLCAEIRSATRCHESCAVRLLLKMLKLSLRQEPGPERHGAGRPN